MKAAESLMLSAGARIALVSRTDETDTRNLKVLRSLSSRYTCMMVSVNGSGASSAVFPWQRRALQLRDRGWASLLWKAPEIARHIESCLTQFNPAVVVAVNEEVAALVVRHKGKLFQALVLDIHDELELRSYTESFAVTSVSRLVAKYARRNADRIICVAEERLALLRPADQRKAVCVHNFPCTPARPIRENITRRDAFSIYVGGSLGEQRGLATLLAAAEMVGARIVSAGRLLDAYARDVFAKHPAVQYNGHVAPERAMELLAGCSASVVFFEPGPKVVELAASNKVYEALFVGRPILANREMGTAPWIVREQVGYAVPYADSAALADVFREIQTDKDGWQNMCRRARRTFEAGAYSWESQEPVLFKMLDDLIQKRG